MKIEKIEFRNLFSYGEQVQEINYDDTGKLILLKGQSGAGKSALLSLPCLLLYGKIEKVPKTSIANRIILYNYEYLSATVYGGNENSVSHRYAVYPANKPINNER